MARYADIFLLVFLFNLGLSGMGSIPFYQVGTQVYTIGTGIHFNVNGQLQSGYLLNTVGCSQIASNLSISCTAPSALSNPSFINAQVFGYIYGGLIAIFSMAAAPYFVYNLIYSFFPYLPLAVITAGGLGVIYYYFIILVLTGRYFEQ